MEEQQEIKVAIMYIDGKFDEFYATDYESHTTYMYFDIDEGKDRIVPLYHVREIEIIHL